jgi:DNA-binding winged helix-turn-helix (wHTH) protein
MQNALVNGTLRFSVFEVDLHSGELRKRGVRVPLQQQPFLILTRLIEYPGEVVAREALRQELWPADTYVDFEQGINAAVKRLREALGDSAETPRFIETLPKRGYRFIAPVNSPNPVTPETGLAETHEHEGVQITSRRLRQVAIVVLVLAAISGAGIAAFLWSGRGGAPAVSEPALVRLTSNPSDMALTSAYISRDGRHLAYADRTGLQVRSIDSGRVHRFADTEGMDVYGWTPDSAGILTSRCDDVSCVGWSISLVGQDRHRTGTVWGRYDQVQLSPDGQHLLRFTWTKWTLAVDPMNGSPTQVVATGSDILRFTWSTDGTRVLIVRGRTNAIESVPAEGGTPLEVYRGPKDTRITAAIELPDRTILIAMYPAGSIPQTSGQSELWRAHPDRTGVLREAPRRLTWSATDATPLTVFSMTVSSNGRVALLSTRFQSDVYVTDGDLRNDSMQVPRRFTLSESDNVAYTWTPDSSAILLSSNRQGTWDILKQRLDSDIAEPFLSGARHQGYPGVTNDGRWVLYADGTGRDDSIMRASLSGGAAAAVVPHVGRGVLQCAQHGRCVLLERKDRTFVISSLHPFQGKGTELARIPLTSGFRLLPDGDTFAYILPTENGYGNRVRVISFAGKPDKDIVVKDAAALASLGWLPSNSGFLSTDRGNWTDCGKLLLVFPDGTSKVLWAPTGLASVDWAVPSPDEKHLAINVSTRHSNAWMVSGF